MSFYKVILFTRVLSVLKKGEGVQINYFQAATTTKPLHCAQLEQACMPDAQEPYMYMYYGTCTIIHVP